MRILVAVPAVSLAMASKIQSLESFLSVDGFEPSGTDLDVFPREMKGVSPKNFWTINVPHWPLSSTGTRGVAGPGRPQDELFCPAYLEKHMRPLCGKYDKWRPYPAEKPLSNYNLEMASRFGRKRCKMLGKIVDDMPCEVLFYVEHGPASLAHLSRGAATEAADQVIGLVREAAGKHPAYDVVVFSPYGIGGKPGFVASNHMESKKLSNWADIRRYLNGNGAEGPPDNSPA